MNENKQAKTTLLLVDDDRDYTFQKKLELEGLGYCVHTAHSRPEAKEKFNSNLHQCVVMDLMMDEEDDGFILAHELKKKEPNLPIILVTSVSTQDGICLGPMSATQKKWLNVDVVLTKPIRIEQLHREIERALT